tara:strand:+ start:18903 stop:19532 length:630 start_codon:yes stop_codon:yes gene_type:complete
MRSKLKSLLEAGMVELCLPVENQQINLLLDYLEILKKWNEAYNLTAIRNPEDMVVIHLLDSLSIAPFIKGKNILDVGTGAGLPGIPLAILYPEHRFTLLDSNGKKIRFLFQVKNQLGLKNVNEVQGRAEKYQTETPFNSITSRAFSSLTDMVEKTKHLLGSGGRLYAMKGQLPDQELSMLPKHYKVIASHHVAVPGVNNKRHLIEIELS